MRLWFVLLLVPALASADERKVVIEKDGCVITVGDRDARGTDKLIATCTWDVPLAGAVAVVKEADRHDDYLSSVLESTRLPDGRVLQVHDASPLSERQVTLSFHDEAFADGGVRVWWTRSLTQEPLKDGRVEVPLNDGSWEVHPDGGGTKAIYTLRYDAGGSVPDWLVRNFQKSGSLKLVGEMREAARKR